MSELGHEHHGWDSKLKLREAIKECGVVFDSEMPDIIKMRKEFKEKFGSTELFDYFYINLRNQIAKDTMKGMIDGKKFGKLIHEQVKASMEVVDD